jgi:hypothetical protein
LIANTNVEHVKEPDRRAHSRSMDRSYRKQHVVQGFDQATHRAVEPRGAPRTPLEPQERSIDRDAGVGQVKEPDRRAHSRSMDRSYRKQHVVQGFDQATHRAVEPRGAPRTPLEPQERSIDRDAGVGQVKEPDRRAHSRSMDRSYRKQHLVHRFDQATHRAVEPRGAPRTPLEPQERSIDRDADVGQVKVPDRRAGSRSMDRSYRKQHVVHRFDQATHRAVEPRGAPRTPLEP